MSSVYDIYGINYYKDMLEKLNITISFELINGDITFCQNCIRYSILNGNNENIPLDILSFIANKSEYDNFDDRTINQYNLVVSETNNNLIIKIQGNFQDINSIVIKETNGEPLNNVQSHCHNNELDIVI